ncbi:MAG TPA: tetratricopeptide repeat protein, partial [Blastocatellia bacterium]|nr:tetratricopeptide repeat protein [Blastocatellia bacterium]
YYYSGDKQVALSYFDKAFQLKQNNLKKGDMPEVGLFFARLNNELGNKQKAYDIYSKLFDLYQKAGDIGSAARMLAVMGEISYSTGKKQQAIEHFEQLLQMHQQNRKVREKISLAYLIPALESIYSEVGKPQNKVELFDKVPTDYRGDKQVWQLEVFLARGSISLGSGDKQSASNYVDQALQIVQNNPKYSQNINLLIRLAYFYKSLGNKQKTLELAEKSFSILSKFSRINKDRSGRYELLYVAEMFTELGERQKASEAYQMLEITPEYINYSFMEDYNENRP